MKTKQLLTVAFCLLLFFKNYSQESAPTLTTGLDNVAFNKGTLDVELISKIISEKQKEIVREGIKRVLFKSFINNKDLDNYTQFYIERIVGIIFEEKNHQIITKRVLEESTNYLFVLGASKFILETDIKGLKKYLNIKNEEDLKLSNLNKIDRENIFKIIISVAREIPLLQDLGILNRLNYYELENKDFYDFEIDTTNLIYFDEKINFKNIFLKYKKIDFVKNIKNNIHKTTLKKAKNKYGEDKINDTILFEINKDYYLGRFNLLKNRLLKIEILKKNKIRDSIKEHISTIIKKSRFIKDIISKSNVDISSVKSLNDLINSYDEEIYLTNAQNLIFNNTEIKELSSFQEIKSFFENYSVQINDYDFNILNKLNESKKSFLKIKNELKKTNGNSNLGDLINEVTEFKRITQPKIIFKDFQEFENLYTKCNKLVDNLSKKITKDKFTLKTDFQNINNEISFIFELEEINRELDETLIYLNLLKKIKKDINDDKEFYEEHESHFIDYINEKELIPFIQNNKIFENSWNSIKIYKKNDFIEFKKSLELIIINNNLKSFPNIKTDIDFKEISNKLPNTLINQNVFLINKISKGGLKFLFTNEIKDSIFSLNFENITLTEDEAKSIKILYKIFQSKNLINKIENLNIISEINSDLLSNLRVIKSKISKKESIKLEKIINSIEFSINLLRFEESQKLNKSIKIKEIEPLLNFLKFIGNIKELNKAETFGYLLKTIKSYEVFLNVGNSTIIPDLINSLSNYSIINLEKNSIEIDAASLLTHIADKYSKDGIVKFYATVGLNQNRTFNGEEFNAASEKIGIKIRLHNFDKDFKGLYHKVKNKSFLSESYFMIYGSGILYKIAKTTDERFNDFNFGFATGFRFYNALDLNINIAIPASGFKNTFYGVSLDIPLSEYLKRL